MSKQYKIYKVVNTLNNKIYVGKTVRTGTEYDKYFGSGILIKNAINKHGLDNFTKELIEECTDADHMNDREKYWISTLNTITPNGYNIHYGGEGGDSFYYMTTEQKDKIFEKRIANNPDMYTKIWESRRRNGTDTYSGQALLNITLANRAKARDPIVLKKISDYQLMCSSTIKKYHIQILPTNEIVELIGIGSVKQYVMEYNISNNKKYRERSNYWKLLYGGSTNDMILLKKPRVNV
jgi:group I intron endonuclease